MERSLCKIVKIRYIENSVAEGFFGQHYRTVEVPGGHGIVVFDHDVDKHSCDLEFLAMLDEQPPSERAVVAANGSKNGYLGRFGEYSCTKCHDTLAWSPNWVAWGVYGDDTLEWLLRSLGRMLAPFGLTDPKEFLWNAMTSASLYLDEFDFDNPAKITDGLMALVPLP